MRILNMNCFKEKQNHRELKLDTCFDHLISLFNFNFGEEMIWFSTGGSGH